MKKTASIILTIIMLFALCVPAFADVQSANVVGTTAPAEATFDGSGNIVISEAGDFIVSESLDTGSLWILNSEATLTIAEGKTVTVTSVFNIAGTINLLGTLDIRQCGEISGIDMVMISETGSFLTGDLDGDDTEAEEGTVTLHFDGNYSEVNGVPEDITAEKGEAVIIPDVKPLRANYVFQGWSENCNATTTQYKIGYTLKAEKSITLYAVWASSSGSGKWLHYNENSDGENVQNMPASRRATSTSCSFYISKATPVREGYTFTSWNTKADGSGTAYNSGAMLRMGGKDINLYAQWEKADINTGSTISDGNVLIVIAIAAAVIFGFSGFFLGKKKKEA